MEHKEIWEVEQRYYVQKWGLLYIVYERDYGGMSPTFIEESRWEDEKKAKDHCKLLCKNK